MDKLLRKLQKAEDDWKISLSAYGFVLWVVDTYGYKSTYKNLLSSDPVIDRFVKESVRMRDDMPALVLNANTYVTRIMSNVADLDTCFTQLEGMTFPYVLYILFAGCGQREQVEKYRPEMEEFIKRYPSALDLLPESFKAVGAEVLNANA